jgi:hypothetical protein
MKPEQEIKEEPDSFYRDGVRYTHPAFGVAVITKQQGAVRLFGSDLIHNEAIAIELHEADEVRSLSHDWRHGGKMITRFIMSEAQWARFVSAQGRGEGVPVTVEYRQDPSAPMFNVPSIAAPKKTKLDTHRKEVQDGLKKSLADALVAITDLAKMAEGAGAVPKREFRDKVANAKRLLEQLPGNTAFVLDSFEEAMESVAEDAKIEVEAYFTNAIQRAGLSAIEAKGLLPYLSPPTNKETTE